MSKKYPDIFIVRIVCEITTTPRLHVRMMYEEKSENHAL